MKTYEISIRVRYGETDQMGVVHHGNYALYLEEARTEWLRQLGVSYKEMEANGIMLPVVSMYTKYLKPAYYDDVLQIRVELVEKPSVKISFNYTIYNQEKELLAEANVVLAFLNATTKRPMRCPQEILDKLLY